VNDEVQEQGEFNLLIINLLAFPIYFTLILHNWRTCLVLT